mgnify:CR=1 FL=1
METIAKINDAFRKCFIQHQNILSAENTNDIDLSVQVLIKKEIPDLLAKYLGDSYSTKGSIGAGRATKTPWIAILDKDITGTTRKGVYVVFLFSSDCQHVYITLNQGTTQPNQFGPRLGKREINKKAQEIRDNLAINNDILKTDGNADVYDERYQAGAIYYTLWDVDDDLKDKELLDLYIQIYKQYKGYGHIKTTTYTVVMPKYYKYLTALRTKPFMLLAGISGTGKSRIVREMAKACWASDEEDYGNNCPRNFCMVQVKPNWHDSSELIGYVSRINGEKYIVGPFLRFIAQALKEPRRPYFLCLDEMNLAPVEQYFAEFLSVIESRHLQDDGQIVTDPIVPYDGTEAYDSLINQLFESDEERRKAYKTEKIEEGGKRLTIPQNLFVVGTVNMDETTFSFSRKVLDRAMTIEMNEVKLDTGLNANSGNELGYIGSELMGQAVEGRDIYADNQPMCDKVIAYLQKVNEVLDATPFKIAYRTRNEFLLYAVNRKTFAPESELWQTLDEMTSMKILSRIEGDTERCEKPLRGLEALLRDTLGDHAVESVSLRKIEEMTRKLQSGYTSYWT